jgi:hypothetical protein
MSWLSDRLPARSSGKPSMTLADEFLESYVCWREACEDVRAAYDRWRRSESTERGLAFEVYNTALDREEIAAHVHSDRTQQLRTAAA